MSERVRIGSKIIDFELMTHADLDRSWYLDGGQRETGVILYFVGGGFTSLTGAEASAARQYLTQCQVQPETPVEVELPGRAGTYRDDEIMAGLPADLQAMVKSAESRA